MKEYLIISLVLLQSICIAQGNKVYVQKNLGNEYTLVVNDKPFFIKGGGGSSDWETLAQCGGNSVRTWGLENARVMLDRAHSLGLKVMMGMWMQHERHGFDYDDKIKVKDQLEFFKSQVIALKDHPALLIWGVGNEVDLFYSNTNVWYAVEDIAKMIHEIDPNHPTCTVTAGLDSSEVRLIKERAPSIDIYGINTYGDISSVREHLSEYGWDGPYMITEWGPNGHWEVSKTKWRAPIEQTSSEKAISYGMRYQQEIQSAPKNCLGSYAFLWGHKQETTSTWYGLFSKHNEKTEAGSENLIPGLPCTVTNFGFTNRQLVVTGDTVLPLTCWASCGDCLNNYNVTFQVDMSNVSGFNVPEVNGDFNGWCGGCFQLTDPDGNGIYTGTATIQEGLHEFKYAYDGWSGQESLTSGTPCTVTNFGFTNRSINVTQNVTLPVVCYGSCSGCSYAVSNDSPYSATSFNYNVNQNYPNCDPLSNTLAGCTDSPQSASVGPDRWYKFIAQSTAVSITLSSASQDDFIELYSRTGNSFTLLDSENASAGDGDYEKLNYSGLTIGDVYYISIGGSVNGAFTLCIQHLLRSWGAYSQPASGFQLCSNYKCVYRGNSSNNVSYTFNFTETGGTETAPFETTAASTSSTYIALNNPVLALQYGGVYNVQVDALYNLTNSAGAPNPISIPGLITDPNSTGVTMGNHSLLEVRSSQRCPASLFRGTYLNGARVGGANPICGALNYTYEFQQVAACNDGSTVGLANTYTNSSSSPYLQLGVLPTGVNAGAWDVRIKPNFSYGSGTYGPVQRIRVNGTAAGAEIIEELAISERENYINETSVYPNPSDGTTLNVRANNLKHEIIQLRITDALGKTVWSQSLSNNGEINSTINFTETLCPGVYNLEIMDGNDTQASRLIVQ